MATASSHPDPKGYWLYPRLSRERLKAVLSQLGIEDVSIDDRPIQIPIQRWISLLMLAIFTVPGVALLTFAVWYCGIFFFYVWDRRYHSFIVHHWWGPVWLLLFSLLYLLYPVLMRRSTQFADEQFQGTVIKAWRRTATVIPKAQSAHAHCARRAFNVALSGRFSWRYPPAAGDRAVKIAYAFLCTDWEAVERLSKPERQAITNRIRQFLLDTAGLMYLHLEYEIPTLRIRFYGDIPIVKVTEPVLWLSHNVGISARDASYLDPMRDQGRWEIVRKFGIPAFGLILTAVAILNR